MPGNVVRGSLTEVSGHDLQNVNKFVNMITELENWCAWMRCGHVWMGCGHVNAVVTCEWVRSNSGGHVWKGWSHMKGVWSCEQGRRVNWVRCGTLWMRKLHVNRSESWSCVNGVVTYEGGVVVWRGRRVNWVRCDTFYFELLIKSWYIVLLQCSFKRVCIKRLTIMTYLVSDINLL